MARIAQRSGVSDNDLLEFWPNEIECLPVPVGVDSNICQEFQEAERCASVAAYRAGCALLRSVLEKSLKHFEINKGTLQDKINEAAKLAVINQVRATRAHEHMRVLGNDILHDEWRPVTQEEWKEAHRYCQRILEDLFDDPKGTAAQIAKARPTPVPPAKL